MYFDGAACLSSPYGELHLRVESAIKHHVPKVLVCGTQAKEHREVLFGVFTGLALIDDDSHTLNMLQ